MDPIEPTLPKEGTEPIELQVTQFGARVAAVLDDVLVGQRYIISAHDSPKALLRPLKVNAPAPAGTRTVTRREFAPRLHGYLDEVQSGASLVIRSAKTEGAAHPEPVMRAEAVVAEPAPTRLVEERRARAEERRKESGRRRMRKVRERRGIEEAQRKAEVEAKLKAIEGLSLDEVKRAVELLRQHK